MALLEILDFYKRYHAKRVAENPSQRELLWQESQLLLAAVGGVILLFGFLGGLAWYFTR